MISYDAEGREYWCDRPTGFVRAQEGGLQRRLDFTPAASELAHVIRRRESKASKILDRLRVGPATSIELAQITHRFSARILELRQTYRIDREDHSHDGLEWSVYTLRGEK